MAENVLPSAQFENGDDLAAQLAKKSASLGFDFFGIIPARPAKRLDAYLDWIAREYHGEMGYLARPDRTIRRRDLNVIVPGVQSIVCVGMSYFPGKLPPEIARDPSRGRISNYAWGVDYHEVMTPRLQALADWLDGQGNGRSQSRVYVDTGAILERDHGEAAGFGFTGKNTLLINPRRGSWFFLGEILTTTVLRENGEGRMEKVSCGSCRRCQDVCPTAAFPQPYVLDARRCISYLTIELKGWIPRELRPLIGNWIYGCDLCQEVCPFNRFARPVQALRLKIEDWEAASQPLIFNPQSFNHAAPPLLEILALDEAAFQERFVHSPIKRIKRRRLLRNACVAAGNWGSETAVPHLISLLADPEPLLRGHAAWALLQIGGERAETAVAQARAAETDETVRGEMSLV
jgi:epoxyqueuosine reductase